MTYTVRQPFTYMVRAAGLLMPAVIDGTWRFVCRRGDNVTLQKETGHAECSYDGTYITVGRYVLGEAFAEVDAGADAGGVGSGGERVHAGCSDLGRQSDEAGGCGDEAELFEERSGV